jgi:hypothetical protein
MEARLVLRHLRRPATPLLLHMRLWPGGGRVPDRLANVIILGEDQEHQSLVRRYLLRAGRRYANLRSISSPAGRGSGSQYVREQFPLQVAECRATLGHRSSCVLIVITDADEMTTMQREQTLNAQMAHGGGLPITQAEPIIILIPKWQVETWVKCVLGEAVSENDQRTDKPAVDGDQIKRAAGVIFDWARPNAQVGSICVPSLTAALPRWRRIA